MPRREMACNRSGWGKLLAAGGILSIIAGIYLIIIGLLFADIIPDSLPLADFFMDLQIDIFLLLSMLLGLPLLVLLGDLAGVMMYASMGLISELLLLVCNGVLGIMAVVGGISAIKRKWFRISLAGAIYAVPSVILGILAVNLIVLGKREFESKEIDAGVV